MQSLNPCMDCLFRNAGCIIAHCFLTKSPDCELGELCDFNNLLYFYSYVLRALVLQYVLTHTRLHVAQAKWSSI